MKHVIVDLDGTLAVIEHRRHLARGKNKNWKKFEEACVDDLPNGPVIEVVSALHMRGYVIHIFSGRSEAVKPQTLTWLRNNFVQFDSLTMRPEKDYTPDQELKRKWLYENFPNKEVILCVIDDRRRVVSMWREEGLTCLQVDFGEFDEIKKGINNEN